MERTTLGFLDDFWLDHKINIQRKWYSPKWIGTYKEPSFPVGVYPSIIWCPEINKYRLWYEVLPCITVDLFHRVQAHG
jgi:hypothetical protein